MVPGISSDFGVENLVFYGQSDIVCIPLLFPFVPASRQIMVRRPS